MRDFRLDEMLARFAFSRLAYLDAFFGADSNKRSQLKVILTLVQLVMEGYAICYELSNILHFESARPLKVKRNRDADRFIRSSEIIDKLVYALGPP